MATEEKKYLVNVEDNLDEYAKRAEDAAKQVDQLTIENLKLRNSSKASAEEIQKSDAALRVAQQEYKNAKKNVDLATKANVAQAGSYEKLYRQWQLAQTQLKLLGNAYTTNSKGVRVLSQEYINQKKVVEDAKRSLDSFGKGVADNRLNVGNYSEAVGGAVGQLQMMPGALGQATAAVQRFGKALLGLLTNPIVLLIAAITAALYGLFKAFKSTNEGSTELEARFNQLKAVIDVLRQRVVGLIDVFKDLFSGRFKEAAEGFRETFAGMGDQIREATRAVYDFTYALDNLEDAQKNFISTEAELNREIARLEFTAQDAQRSTQERERALTEAIRLSEQLLAKQKGFAEERFNLEAENLARLSGLRQQDVIDYIKATDEQRANASTELQEFYNTQESKIQELEQVYADWINLDTRFYDEQRRNITKLASFRKEMEKEALLGAQAAVKYLTELTKSTIADWQNELKEAVTATDEALKAQIESAVNEQMLLAQGLLTDFENQQALLEQQYLGQFDARRNALEQQYAQELAMAEQTGADKTLIYQKYANAEQQIEAELQNAKLDLASGFADNLAQIFGEQTAIGKAAAIAQTLIQTYQSATAAFSSLASIPVVGPILGAAAAAAAIAAGLANVKKIASVKSGLPGDSGSRSTSISGSPAAARAYAAPVGTTSTLTPQLTQAETNTLPNQQIFTPNDLVTAFQAVPAPIVTVEDINARQSQTKKVEVRATI